MPTKLSCDGCFYQCTCKFDRAIRCLTDNYALRIGPANEPVGHAEALRKDEDNEETNGGEIALGTMEGKDPG